MPRVSLVGYTNAGKSTLFNALVKARAYAADQLFATLDTTTRVLFIEGTGRLSLSDTVGFIRDLPHRLVEAFRATLQEAAEADLLLHVVDMVSANRHEQIAEVQRVLGEIGAAEVPQIVVFNKIDGLDPAERPREATDHFELPDGRRVPRVFVSAQTGEGLDALRKSIVAALTPSSEAPYGAVSDPMRSAPAFEPAARGADDPTDFSLPSFWSPTGTDP